MKNSTLSVALLACAICTPALAADYTITLKDHQFSPSDIKIPANKKVSLIVKNDSDATAEFDSAELDREKVVKPHEKIIVAIGPLTPGTYGYYDDFNRDSTGTVIVK